MTRQTGVSDDDVHDIAQPPVASRLWQYLARPWKSAINRIDLDPILALISSEQTVFSEKFDGRLSVIKLILINDVCGSITYHNVGCIVFPRAA